MIVDETNKQKQLIVKIFNECYSKFILIEYTSDNSLLQFQTILEQGEKNTRLDLTCSILLYFFMYDSERCEEIRNAYKNNLEPLPTELAKYKNIDGGFSNHYLMTQFFLSEGLTPHENFSLGYRQIKKDGNEDLYYKFYHYVIYELQQLIFNTNKLVEVKEKLKNYIPFQPHAKLLNPIKNMDFELFLQSYPNVKIYPPNCTNVFTRKLNNIFAILKSKGDTHLKIKDVTSYCKCGNCKNHPNKYIYAFVGNVSADYFALTMLINRDYEPHLIDMPLPIYDIKNERDDIDAYNETTKGQKFGQLHTFKIWEDEYDNFIPTQEYCDFKEFRHNAYNDLKQLNYKIETYDELKNWLKKNDKNKIKLVNKCESLVEFVLLYEELENIAKHCIYIPQTDLAMSKLPVDYETNHDALVKWLIEFENLFIYELNDFSNSNDFFIHKFASIITVNKDFNCELCATIVGSIIPFLEVYKSYYYNELERLRELYHSQENTQLTAEEIENDYMCNELSYFYNLMN